MAPQESDYLGNDLFEFKMYATNKCNRPFEVVHLVISQRAL